MLSLWRRLLAFGNRHSLPVSEGNAVRILETGASILEASRQLIAEARHTLHFEIYIWNDDPTGREFLDALLAARARGVVIRGVVDQVGSWSAEAMMQEAWKAGMDVRFYNPIGLALPRKAWSRRNHRKLVIADGAAAVIGSANWADDYNCARKPDSYLDMGLEITGPVLADLNQDFAECWSRVDGPPFPDPTPTGGPLALCRDGWFLDVPIQVLSSLQPRHQPIRRHLLLVLRQVRHKAIMASAYFVPDPKVLRVLIRTARRGVSTDLILPGASDHPTVQAAGRATFERLLEAGVRIWERRDRMLHTKAAILDQEIVIIGSANLDALSFRRNLELNLVLRSQELAASLERLLLKDRVQSQPWDLAKWKAQPFWRHAWQRLIYALWPWL